MGKFNGVINIYYNESLLKSVNFISKNNSLSIIAEATLSLNRLSKGVKYIDIVFNEPIEDRQGVRDVIVQYNSNMDELAYFLNQEAAVKETKISKASICESVNHNKLLFKKYYFKKFE